MENVLEVANPRAIMPIQFHVMPVPAEAIAEAIAEDGAEFSCHSCGAELSEDVYYDGDSAHYCKGCIDELIEEEIAEAEQYAIKHCKVTCRFPQYDPIQEYACTPEEYEMGDRESYTPNAYECYCRHKCTNYDELIKPLSREYVFDRIRYLAIRERIDELVEETVTGIEGDTESPEPEQDNNAE